MTAERIITYHIKEEDLSINTTIREYLRARRYSHRLISHLIRTENGMLCNGRSVHTDHLLKSGDVLSIRLAEEASVFPPFRYDGEGAPFRIVYEDEDIFVLDKAAGLPVHPSLNNKDNTLAGAICGFCEVQKKPLVYRCVNRLDRDTTGLTIIARHMLSACVLSDDLKKRQIRRTYMAIVKGWVKRGGSVNAPISRQEGSIILRRVNFERGEEALTHYEPLSYSRKLDLTLLRVWLETGRTHQIRVHMRHIGYPLIGDYLYYPDMSYIGRQALHSSCLEFNHPVTGAPMCLTAPLPADMRALFPDYPRDAHEAGHLS